MTTHITHTSERRRRLHMWSFILLVLVVTSASCDAACTGYPPLTSTDSLHSFDTGIPNLPSCHLLTLPISATTSCRTGCANGYYPTQTSSWQCVTSSWSGQGAACSKLPPLAQPYPYSPTPNFIPVNLGTSVPFHLQSDQVTGRMFASGLNDTTGSWFIVEFDLGATADSRSADNYRRVFTSSIPIDSIYYTPAIPSAIFAYCDNDQSFNVFNRTDGSQSVLTHAGTLRSGYSAAPNIANVVSAGSVAIGSFAFDANGVMFFVVHATPASATSFFPNLGVYVPSSGQVIPLNGTELLYESSYGHAPPVYLTQLQFGGGYLWMLNNYMAIYRTKLPYSAFSSGADLVSNPFIAIEREDRFGGLNSFYVEPVYGNLFVYYSDPVAQVVQYLPIGSGNYQFRTYEAPCSQSAIRFVGGARPSYFGLDTTITPNRFYFTDGTPNQLSYLNVELEPPMSHYELGCLSDPEPLPFYAPTLDSSQVFPFQTVATTPPLPGNLSLISLGSGAEIVLTSDNNGRIYAGKKTRHKVYEYAPGTSLDGTDITFTRNWNLANISLTLQYLIYNTNDLLVYVIDSQGNIATINPSNGNTAMVYTVTDLGGVAFLTIGFSPSNQMYGTTNSNGISMVSVVGGVMGAVSVTPMAFTSTNQNTRSVYSPRTYRSEGTDLRNPIFKNGYLYFHDFIAGYIVRTVFPYSSFISDQDFITNPLIPILDGEGGLYMGEFAKIGGYTIEPTSGTLIAAYWSAFQTLTGHSNSTASVVQHQLIGSTYLQSPWSSPCLTTAVKPVSSFDLNNYAAVTFAFDLSVNRLYWFKLGDSNLQYAPITLQSSLPQSSLGCTPACTTPPPTLPYTTTNCSFVSSSYAHATTCVNTCASGYSGSNVAYRCRFGTWTTSDLISFCYPTPCSTTPPYTAFGSNVTSGCPVSAYPIANGTICSVGCATNYTGTSTLAYQCITGTWISTNTSNHISCVQSCPLVLPVGAVSAGCPNLLDGHGAGACLLSPATGYQMTGGAPFMTCTNGSLSTTAVFTPAPCSTTNLVTSSSLALGTCPGSPPGSLSSGSSCQLACASGWTSTNYTTMSCSYGAWSGTAPICMKQCSNLNTTVIIGATSGNCTSVIDGNNGQCQLTQTNGYTLTGAGGSLTMTCTNGTYSAFPVLSPNPCSGSDLAPQLTAIMAPNTCPSASSTPLGSGLSCQLGCASTYTSISGGQQNCLLGNWSGTLPACKLQCQPYNVLVTLPTGVGPGNCTVILDGNAGTCILSLSTGYTLTLHSLTQMCVDGAYPTPIPVVTANPSIGSDLINQGFLVYPMDYGSCPIDSATLVSGGSCQLNCTSGWTCTSCGRMNSTAGQWSGTTPVCRKQCQPISVSAVIGGTPGNCSRTIDGNSGQCLLIVSTGYSLTGGSLTMTCNNGTYSPLPTITANPCPGSSLVYTSPVTFGSCPQSLTSLASSSTCQLSCASGYTSISGGLQSCSFGNWSGSLPSCQRQCPILTAVSPLPTGVTAGNCTIVVDGNSGSCLLIVSNGYTLASGPLSQICVNGVYTTSLPTVTANPSIGSDLVAYDWLISPPMDYGSCPIGSATLVSGGSCQLNCTSGWTCTSCGQMNSTAGQWSGSSPICYKQCPPALGAPPTGASLGNCTQVLDGQGGQCLLTLLAGYLVYTGSLTLTCSNGTYSSLPTIQPIPCPLSSISPTAPYATYGNCTTNLAPGQQCRFGCASGSTTTSSIADQGFQYCQFGGSWSGQQPKCMQQCSQVVPPVGSAPGTCLATIDGNDATCVLALQNGFSLGSGSMAVGCHNGTITSLPIFEATYTPTYSGTSTTLSIAPGSTLTHAILDLPIIVNVTSTNSISSSYVNVVTTFTGVGPKFTSSNAMNFVLNLTCNLLQATCPTQLLLDGVDQNVVWISGINQITLSLAAQANTVDVIQPIDVNTNTLQTLRLQLIEPPTDSCFNIICQNSGTCLPQPSLTYSTAYTCYCSASFTGSLCQTSLAPASNGTSGGSGGTSSGGTSTTPPVSVVYPQALITAPTSVSACDSLILDGRLSYNLGPISLSPYYHWSITSIMLNNIEILDNTSPKFVVSFAISTWTTAGPNTLTGSTIFTQTDTISASPLNMIDGATYTFQLIVGNALLTSTPATVTITKLAPLTNAVPWTPTISIQSPSQITRASINHFASVIIPSTCQSIPLDVIYTFGWSVQVKGRYVNDTTTGLTTLNTTIDAIPQAYQQYSTTTRDLDIPINYLYVGYVYSIGLTVDLVSASGISSRRLLASAQSVTSISAVDVSPQPSPIQANIIGGARSRRADQIVIISGEQSYDPDYTGSNSLDGVTFAWSCQNSLDHSACSLPSVSLVDSILALPADSLPVGSYVITVAVTSTTGTTRSASSGIVLTITPAPTANSITPPIVSILKAPTRINSVSILRLVATALNTTNTKVENLKFMWSITSSTTSVLPNLFDSNNLGAPANTSTLVLLGGQLTPGVYELTVLVTDPYFIDPTTNQPPSSFATVSITVNSIPQPGTCQITPLTGITLNTSFSLSCSNWYEPLSANYQPFSYAVEYVDVTNIPANTTLSDSSFHQLTDYSLLSTATFTLPIGQLRLRAFIRDALGAYASVDLDVSVTPPTVDTSTTAAANAYASGVISTQLSSALQAGSNQDAANIIQQLITVLNISDSAIVDAGTTAVVGDLLDALIVVWEQCSDQTNTTQHPTESTTTPQKPVSNICVTLVSQTLSTLTQHQSVLNFTLTKLTKATNLLSSIISTTIASNIDPSSGTSASLGAIASNLMVQCSQLDDISELVQRVLQIDQAHAVAGEKLSLHTTNFDATVEREFVSAGTALKLPTGQTVTLSPEAMASYAAQVNQGLNISTIDTSTTGAVEMDTRVVTFSSEWSSCRGSDSLSNIQTIELTTPDGRPINIGLLGHAIEFDVPLNSNKTNAALEDAQSKLCPGDPFNATDAADKAFSCSFWNTTTHSYSTAGCISRGVVLSYNSSIPSILTCDCNHLTEFAILYQEATSVYSGCPSPTSLGHWSYLFFFFWYVTIGFASALQLSRVLRRFRFGKYWLMTTEHALICTTCVFRALNMIIFWKLYAHLSLSVQTILSGMPYVFLNWIFTLVIVAWASIWEASERGERTNDPFKPYQSRFILVNSMISCALFLIFVSMSSTTDLNQISKLNQWGVGLTSGIQIALAIFFVLYGTLLVRSLTEDFVSPYAKKLSLVAVSLSSAFLISASILIFSIIDESTYQNHLKLFDSFYYGLDLCGLCIIMGLFSKSVNDVIVANDNSLATKTNDSGSAGDTRKGVGSVAESRTTKLKGTLVEKDVVLEPKRVGGWQQTNKNASQSRDGSHVLRVDTQLQTTTTLTQPSDLDAANRARRYINGTDHEDETATVTPDQLQSTPPPRVSGSQNGQEGMSSFNLPHRYHEESEQPTTAIHPIKSKQPIHQSRSSSNASDDSDSSPSSSDVSSSDTDSDLDDVSQPGSSSAVTSPINRPGPYVLRSPAIHVRTPLSQLITDSPFKSPNASPATPLSPNLISPIHFNRSSLSDIHSLANGPPVPRLSPLALTPTTTSIVAPVQLHLSTSSPTEITSALIDDSTVVTPPEDLLSDPPSSTIADTVARSSPTPSSDVSPSRPLPLRIRTSSMSNSISRISPLPTMASPIASPSNKDSTTLKSFKRTTHRKQSSSMAGPITPAPMSPSSTVSSSGMTPTKRLSSLLKNRTIPSNKK